MENEAQGQTATAAATKIDEEMRRNKEYETKATPFLCSQRSGWGKVASGGNNDEAPGFVWGGGARVAGAATQTDEKERKKKRRKKRERDR